MSKLKEQLIRLGYESPELRDHLRPVLDTLSIKNASESRQLLETLERSLKRDGASALYDFSGMRLTGNSYKGEVIYQGPRFDVTSLLDVEVRPSRSSQGGHQVTIEIQSEDGFPQYGPKDFEVPANEIDEAVDHFTSLIILKTAFRG